MDILELKDLIKFLGGEDNIISVSHCATRLRFVLVDTQKAAPKKIDELSFVRGTFTNAGQFQVIIGPNVAEVYHVLLSKIKINAVSKEEGKQLAIQQQNKLQQIASIFAEIFAPLIPAIVVGGLLLGFRNILEGIQWEIWDGKTIVEVSVFWNGINDFLWLICEAIFHFLPVGVTWSISKKMGTTEILGIILGITLVSPQLLNAYGVAGASSNEIPFWDFGIFQIDKIGYQAQVIPAMLAGFMLCYLERYFRKHIPHSVSMIFVPLFSLVPTVLAAHVILGPVGWKLGSMISIVILKGITSPLNWIFGFFYGLLYAPLVITGLHHMFLTIDLQMIADIGGTPIWPMVALSNIAQGSAVLAIIYMHKGNKKEEQVSVPAVISAYLGVTEPALFGINLKYLYPFLAGMIGSAFASMLNTLLNIRSNSIGIGGLPGILSFDLKFWPGYILCVLVAIVVSIVFTLLLSKNKKFNQIDKKESNVI